jgi:hypothetical protein
MPNTALMPRFSEVTGTPKVVAPSKVQREPLNWFVATSIDEIAGLHDKFIAKGLI